MSEKLQKSYSSSTSNSTPTPGSSSSNSTPTPGSSSSNSTPTPSSSFSNSSSTSNEFDYCQENLEDDFKKLNCSDENYYSKECNKFLLKKELIERNCLSDDSEEYPYLYPQLNDKEFNIKIAEKKEFNDTKYDGTIHTNIADYADMLSKADYELQPHQLFVKNFMSFQTPYNSLLLYHGLGSGKTCSAIGVCEENRDYMKQMGITKRIIIVASENVQDNFKLQLFDERKLKLIDGIWNIQSCTGNKLLKEINPMNMKGMSKEKIVSQIKNIINTYYIFLGYGQFANYIIKIMNYEEEERNKQRQSKKQSQQTKQPQQTKQNTKIQTKDTKVNLNKTIIKRLQNEFNARMIVIDEIHNIRMSEDNENKKVAVYLELLVKSAENMRFLFLSATPMYNNYKEIIWLLNLMNVNDRRAKINVKDVFDKHGNFKKDGKEILIRKATGYVSFVRGENPYTFPYRVYPNEFAKENTFPSIKYPDYQMNLKKIKSEDKKRILSLYLTTIGDCENCGECQGCSYKYIIHKLRNKKNTITTKKGQVRVMPSFENMESFGYTMLQIPIESLIISYPIKGLKEVLDDISDSYSEEYSPSFSELETEKEETNENEIISSIEELQESQGEEEEGQEEEEGEEEEGEEQNSKEKETNGGSQIIESNQLTGKLGLERMMDFVDSKSPFEKGNFEYKKTTLSNYGRIFSQENIGKYSSKIKCIIDKIYNPTTKTVSEGIILIYSQYIDSGLIPMALALEELGFTRFGEGAKPLFKNKPSPLVDARTMKPPTDKNNFFPARYSIITGDPRISPNNDFEVKGLTGEDNKYGNKIKVILISKAGSEGIDFKFIRQVHILDPWYNMNRIEQIIGRAVRNFSHKDLPFEKRNVEIYMHGTILGYENKEESADLYVFRVAEYKAIQIGKVSRVLKETAVDCIINYGQTNFTQEKISEVLETPVKQILSTGAVLNDFKIGDSPFSPACDYMSTCDYSCTPDKKIDEENLNEDTYNENFIMMNSEKILQRIRMLMKESYFYKKDVLLSSIQTPKKYPYVQIYSALTQLIEDNNEFIQDKYGRNGRLVNIGEYYLFQPIELKDKNISIFDRMVPIDYKHDSIQFEINTNISRKEKEKEKLEELGIDERKEETVISEGKKIYEELNKNFLIVSKFSKEKKVSRKDDDDTDIWYKYCGIAMKNIKKEYPEITEEKTIEMISAHMIEILLYKDKIELLKYLYSLGTITPNTLTWYLKKYFERISIVTEDFHALILYDLNKRNILILNNDNIWVPAKYDDENEIASSKEAKQLLQLDKNKYNKIIGFIGYEKKNKYLVFKTKNITSVRDTGARCDEAGKSKTLTILNEIIGENKYTNETTRIQKDTDGNVIREALNHAELCVIQEFILRYYDSIGKDNKKWFFTPEMAIYHNLYKIIV